MVVPSSNETPIAVVGAGVIGLTTAIELLRKGFSDVTVIADKWCPDTTSDISCAWWFPAVEGFTNPVPLYKKYALRTLEILYRMAEENDSLNDNGVRIRSGRRFFENPFPVPWFKEAVKNYKLLDKKELLGNCAGGMFLSSAFADMSVFMPWLMSEFESLGGKKRTMKLTKIADAKCFGKVVFNCTGLGARFLEDVNDKAVYPLRGQIVLVHNPSIQEFIGADVHNTRAYVLPRTGGYVVCGGTSDANCFDTTPDMQTAKGILRYIYIVCVCVCLLCSFTFLTLLSFQ